MFCNKVWPSQTSRRSSQPPFMPKFWASRPMKSETNCSYHQGMAFIFNFTKATIDWSIFWSHSTPMSWIVWWRSGSNPIKHQSVLCPFNEIPNILLGYEAMTQSATPTQQLMLMAWICLVNMQTKQYSTLQKKQTISILSIFQSSDLPTTHNNKSFTTIASSSRLRRKPWGNPGKSITVAEYIISVVFSRSW